MIIKIFLNSMLAGLLVIAGTAMGQQMPPSKPSSPFPQITPPNGQGTASAEKLVTIKVVSDRSQIGPGEKFFLAVIYNIEPHWHIYWRDAGATGGPTTVQVTAPPGYTIGNTLYPRPQNFRDDEGVSYGYETQAVLYVEITAPAYLASGSVAFTVQTDFMVCKNVCLLGRQSQMVTVLTRTGDTPAASELLKPVEPLVKDFQSRLPKSLHELQGAEMTFEAGILTIKTPAQGFSTAQFFPVEMPGVTYDDATTKKQDDRLILTVPVHIKPNNALGKTMKIIGTLGLGESQTDPCYDLELAVADAANTESDK